MIDLDQEHAARVAAWNACDQLHPDHYAFRQAFRDSVLAAMDECSDEHGNARVLDRDLPALFRTLDPLAEKLWMRRMGYAV